ncbi:MAG: hypothetical protein ABIK28_24260, partial [Planctomycetota bacterium]
QLKKVYGKRKKSRDTVERRIIIQYSTYFLKKTPRPIHWTGFVTTILHSHYGETIMILVNL